MLVKTVASTILDDSAQEKYKQMMKDPWNMNFPQLLEGLDTSFVMPFIITLGPKLFRSIMTRDSKLSEMQAFMVDVIESGRHSKFLNMLSFVVQQADEDTP